LDDPLIVSQKQQAHYFPNGSLLQRKCLFLLSFVGIERHCVGARPAREVAGAAQGREA
jgi:hypothetical protein